MTVELAMDDVAMDEQRSAQDPTNVWMLSFGTFIGVVAALAALAWSAAESWPGGQLLVQIGAFLVGMAIGVAWVGLALTYLILRILHRPVGGGVGLLVAAVALAVAVVATATHAPLRVRFALSQHSFDQLLDEPVEQADWAPRRIGMYGDASVSREGGDTVVHVLGASGLSGFVHSAEGPPAWTRSSGDAGAQVLSLGDGWYAFWSGLD